MEFYHNFGVTIRADVLYVFLNQEWGGLIAIRHLLFFLDFRHGEMAKMARKNSPLIFAILAINFHAIFVIFAMMAKMANIF